MEPDYILPPIRCTSCGKPLYAKYRRYIQLIKEGVKSGDALESLGLERYCCRMELLSPAILPEGPLINPISTTTDYIVEYQRQSTLLPGLIPSLRVQGKVQHVKLTPNAPKLPMSSNAKVTPKLPMSSNAKVTPKLPISNAKVSTPLTKSAKK